MCAACRANVPAAWRFSVVVQGHSPRLQSPGSFMEIGLYPSSLKVVAFVDAVRPWTKSLVEKDIELDIKRNEELTASIARNLICDVVLIEIDGLSDQALLPILAASRHCAQVGLTAGLRKNRIRAMDLLLDRVAPL